MVQAPSQDHSPLQEEETDQTDGGQNVAAGVHEGKQWRARWVVAWFVLKTVGLPGGRTAGLNAGMALLQVVLILPYGGIAVPSTYNLCLPLGSLLCLLPIHPTSVFCSTSSHHLLQTATTTPASSSRQRPFLAAAAPSISDGRT